MSDFDLFSSQGLDQLAVTPPDYVMPENKIKKTVYILTKRSMAEIFILAILVVYCVRVKNCENCDPLPFPRII